MLLLEMGIFVTQNGGELGFVAGPEQQARKDLHHPVRCHRRVEIGSPENIEPDAGTIGVADRPA